MNRFVVCAIAILHFGTVPAVRAQKPPAAEVNANRVTFAMNFTITPGAATTQVKLDVLVPKSITGRQRIVTTKFSPEPSKKSEKEGNAYAHFVFDDPKAAREITVTVEAEVYRFDFSTAAANKKNRQFEKQPDLKKWLADETFLEKDAPEIQKAAKALLGQTDEETVRKTLAFVTRTLRKGPFDSADHGAVWALQEKRGDCTEFADLFVALCRANGVPARFREGYLIHDVPKDDTPKHDWAEVYLANYGWVPFDPLHTHLGAATAEKLRPIYVYFDTYRRNPVLKNFHFYAYTYRGDPIKVDSHFQIKSRKPLEVK